MAEISGDQMSTFFLVVFVILFACFKADAWGNRFKGGK